jgi:hypothetical protein
VLGLFPVIALGALGFAQKLLVGCLGTLAFWGAYRLVSEVADRPARVAGGLVYLLGPVGYAGIRQGDLGALAFGAIAPFALHALMATTGWVGRPRSDAGRSLARVAVGSALAGAFVPGALLLLALAAAVLAGLRFVLGPRGRAVRGAASAAAGLAAGWALLLPWSASWLDPGGALHDLLGPASWKSYAARFAGQGPLDVLLGQVPEAPGSFGLGLALLAVSAFRLDLPRRRLGLTHGVGIAGLAVGAALLVAGAGSALWLGEWEPGRDAASPGRTTVAQIDSLLGAEAAQGPSFRVLWIGRAWLAGAPPGQSYLVTGSGPRSLADLFAPSAGPGTAELDGVVASVQEGTTDAGGHALGAFNVSFVVVERAPGAHRWLEQTDLELIRSEPEFSLLRNGAPLPRAASYERLPRYVRVLAADDPRLAAAEPGARLVAAARRSTTSFEAPEASGPGVVWLSESRDAGWKAALADTTLERAEAGWGNAFTLPDGLRGRLRVSYGAGVAHVAWLGAFALAWVVALGAAVAGVRTPAREGLR